MNQPLVSIVVTTKNEELNIRQCLESIHNQTYNNIQLCVIDNYSTDKTCQIVQSLGTKLYYGGPERSAQRNLGLKTKSKGKYGMYIDADMMLTKDLVSRCVEQMELLPLSYSGIYIPEIIYGQSLFNRIRRFERTFYNGTVIDAIRFFRMEAFLKVGGFDEELFKRGSGEDWDLDKKIRLLGSTFLLNPLTNNKIVIKKSTTKDQLQANRSYHFIIHDETKLKLIDYLNKKKYYSVGFSGYISKWGTSDPDIQKQFGIKYRFFIVFVEKQKWKKLLTNPYYYLLILAIKSLTAISIIKFNKISSIIIR